MAPAVGRAGDGGGHEYAISQILRVRAHPVILFEVEPLVHDVAEGTGPVQHACRRGGRMGGGNGGGERRGGAGRRRRPWAGAGGGKRRRGNGSHHQSHRSPSHVAAGRSALVRPKIATSSRPPLLTPNTFQPPFTISFHPPIHLPPPP